MEGVRRFADRTDAGAQLAAAVRQRDIDADIALAIPRGGLPLGRAVADALDVPLDIIVAKKIGAPGNPEYAIGAVASDGSVWRNETALRGVDTDYFQTMREEEAANARRKVERYRGDRPEPDLADKTVVVVDDGVATGSTVRACLRRLQETDAGRIVLAIPVCPPTTIDELADETDEIICLETPRNFRGVGQFYENFAQVSDEEAIEYLYPDS